MVEHSTENAGVGSSILPLGILYYFSGRSSVVERVLAKDEAVGSNPIARSISFPIFLPLSGLFARNAALQTNTERGANVRLNVRRECGRKPPFVHTHTVCGDSPEINVSPTVGRSRRLRGLGSKRSICVGVTRPRGCREWAPPIYSP